ncbi:MAG: transglutaminase-like domain-containing protein [bacterium]
MNNKHKFRHNAFIKLVALTTFLLCLILPSWVYEVGAVSSANASHSSAHQSGKEDGAVLATHFEWNEAAGAQYTLPRQIRYTLSVQNIENKSAGEIKLWVYAPSLKTSHQALKDLTVSYPARILQDDEDNIICVFTVPEMAPYETKIFRFKANIAMNDLPCGIPLDKKERYLQAERLIEKDHPQILKKASELQKDDPYQTALSLYQWVSMNIKGAGLTGEDKGALYAIEHRHGDCTEYAALFVALCRACDIPARMLCGYICQRNCIVTAFDFHNWAEFYHKGAWHLVDAERKLFDTAGDQYIATEIYVGEHTNPIGAYHRYRFEAQGVSCKVKMTD